MSPIRCDHVVPCLRAAVIAYNDTCMEATDQEIGEDAFSCVSKTKIDNDIRTQDKYPIR